MHWAFIGSPFVFLCDRQGVSRLQIGSFLQSAWANPTWLMQLAVRRLTTRAGGRRAATDAPQRVLRAAHALIAPTTRGRPMPPSAEAISEAVAAIAAQKNGYQAWSLYVALNQAEVQIAPSDVDQLAGIMLNVDRELDSDVAARRTLSVLEAARREGCVPSLELLSHGAAACALIGLADLAEALCHEAEVRLAQTAMSRSQRPGRRPTSADSAVASATGATSSSSSSSPRRVPHTQMRARLIEACGRDNQPTRAWDEYDSMRRLTGRNPPGYFAGDLSCATALLHAYVASDELEKAFAHFDELCRLANVAGLDGDGRDGGGRGGGGGRHMQVAAAAGGRRQARDAAAAGQLRITAGALTPLLRGCAQRGDAYVEHADRLLALAARLGIDVRSTAVREFARAGTPELLRRAMSLHREATSQPTSQPHRRRMPIASSTVLARACLLGGDTAGAAEALGIAPQPSLEGGEAVAAGFRHAASGEVGGCGGEQDLDSALDLLHSLVRREQQRDAAVRDQRNGPGIYSLEEEAPALAGAAAASGPLRVGQPSGSLDSASGWHGR